MIKKIVKKSKISNLESSLYDVVVIGGGPAGLMAAGTAGKGGLVSPKRNREGGCKVLLIEKNEELGKKLLMTGGGRCNITNLEPDKQKFMSNFGKKKDFLYTPFSVFDSEDTVRFFNSLGIKTKVEENFRVFPESDNSLDILESLIRFARNNNVEFKLGAEVAGFDREEYQGQKLGKIKSVLLKNGTMISAKSFILTSGGKSHPETGSTGDGFVWLKKIGHKVIDSNPALVPIKVKPASAKSYGEAKDNWISELAGVSLQDVGISVWSLDHSRDKQSEKLRSDLNFQKVFKRQGKVLFTHEGLSGPAILNMSKDVGELLSYGNEVKISLDFFSGIGLDVLQEKFKKIFEENKNKKVKNLAFKEVPVKIFEKVLELTGVDGDWNINQIMKEERVMILEKLRKFDFTVEKLLGFDKSIVSSGGLDLKEVDFKTMQSKLYENLFFAGDILDFDRQSGGFSLQLCWTTGYVAGKSAGSSL